MKREDRKVSPRFYRRVFLRIEAILIGLGLIAGMVQAVWRLFTSD